MKLSGLVPMQALGMASRGNKLVKEAEEVCPKCGKAICECGTMGENVPDNTDTNVANGLPQTQGDSKITLSKEHFKNIVREVMKEEEEYQKIFHKMLAKFGVNSPADLTDDQKKKFFTMVKGIQTELKERAKIKEAELKGGQKKLDVDGDGEIEGSDLAKLRNKNEASDNNVYFVTLNASTGKYEVGQASKNASKTQTGTTRYADRSLAQKEASKRNAAKKK